MNCHHLRVNYLRLLELVNNACCIMLHPNPCRFLGGLLYHPIHSCIYDSFNHSFGNCIVPWGHFEMLWGTNHICFFRIWVVIRIERSSEVVISSTVKPRNCCRCNPRWDVQKLLAKDRQSISGKVTKCAFLKGFLWKNRWPASLIMVGVVAVTLGDLIGRRRVWGMSTLCHDNKNEKNQRWGNRSTLYNEINIILIPTIWNHATSIKINIIKIHQIHVVVLGASGPLWRLRPGSLCHFTCKKSTVSLSPNFFPLTA